MSAMRWMSSSKKGIRCKNRSATRFHLPDTLPYRAGKRDPRGYLHLPAGARKGVELLAAVYDAHLPVTLQGYTDTERRCTTLCSPTGPLAQEIVGEVNCLVKHN